jgi:hypothetical protein
MPRRVTGLEEVYTKCYCECECWLILFDLASITRAVKSKLMCVAFVETQGARPGSWFRRAIPMLRSLAERNLAPPAWRDIGPAH